MILIGNNLSFSSRQLESAYQSQNSELIKGITRLEDLSGVDYLDLNLRSALGPSDSALAWALRTVMTVTHRPLVLNSTHYAALKTGLALCSGQVSLRLIYHNPRSWAKDLALADRYHAGIVVRLPSGDKAPRDVYELCVLSIELVEKARKMGITDERIWIDPGPGSMADPQHSVRNIGNFVHLLSGILPGCKVVVSLSDVPARVPFRLKPYLTRAFLMMLMKHDLQVVSLDAFDRELIDIARGKKTRLVRKVHGLMEGDIPDAGALSLNERLYLKMVNVLNGEPMRSYLAIKKRNNLSFSCCLPARSS
jgi:cobalamin-dependent methionine synthase I